MELIVADISQPGKHQPCQGKRHFWGYKVAQSESSPTGLRCGHSGYEIELFLINPFDATADYQL
jgi:hypothetical protein